MSSTAVAARRSLSDHLDYSGDLPQRLDGSTSDLVLLGLLQLGDPAAIAEVWRRHSSMVMAVARRIVRNAALAEEIAQDVMMTLWNQSDRIDLERGSIPSFLRSVTRNRSVDVVRSEVSRRRREEQVHDGAGLVGPDDPIDTILRNELTHRVRGAVSALPSQERVAVELAWFGGHPYESVASTLGIPGGTAKTRIRAGLRRASLSLDDDRQFSPGCSAN
jgi:RNA polymerase sigma-70 factor (ECF subfamily)